MSDEQLTETQTKIQALLQDRRTEQLADSKKKGEEFLADNAKQENVKQLKGGVQYKVIEEGDGESPVLTDTVKVHYTGKLIDGTMFDSSVQRGEPATFRVGQVIKGWQMALQEMKVGDKWMIYIPSELAYGEQGSPGAIGPNQVLVFEVELLGFSRPRRSTTGDDPARLISFLPSRAASRESSDLPFRRRSADASKSAFSSRYRSG